MWRRVSPWFLDPAASAVHSLLVLVPAAELAWWHLAAAALGAPRAFRVRVLSEDEVGGSLRSRSTRSTLMRSTRPTLTRRTESARPYYPEGSHAPTSVRVLVLNDPSVRCWRPARRS